ncbi:MAG: diacylglycerol/lipid kinase family protein [Candidatus Cryptobacteroides sp.]
MPSIDSNNIGTVWLAIVNPHAGSGKTMPVWNRAVRLLESRNIRFEVRCTDCKYHATELARECAAAGYRRFISVGGDGTVHEVLDGLMRFVGETSGGPSPVKISDFVLSVIPIGSGNDWVKSHNVTHDLDRIASLLATESFAKQDVVKVTIEPEEGRAEIPSDTSYMVNVGGVGFDAEVCRRVNAQKDEGKQGKLLYIKSLIYNLFHYKPTRLEIECDGKTAFRGLCLSVAFGTGKYSGGGLRQTPEAVTDDGLVDVTVIPDVSFWTIITAAPKLFTGKLLTVKQLVVRKARKVLVRPLEPVPALVEVDGEILGNVPVRFDVLKDKINVLHDYGR